MVSIQDPDGFLVMFGMPVAVVAWLAVLCRVNALRIVPYLLSSLLAVAIYFVLYHNWPDVFTREESMLLSVGLAIAVGVVMVLTNLVEGFVYVAMLLVSNPIFMHNASLVAAYFAQPDWFGYVLLVVFLLLFLFLLVKSRVIPILGLVVSVTTTSLLLMIVSRIWYLETHGDAPQYRLACGNDADDPPKRCPFAFDESLWNCLFVVFVTLLAMGLYATRSKPKVVEVTTKKKKKEKGKKKNKKKVTAESTDEDTEEEEAATAAQQQPAFMDRLFGKLRSSPTPPPPPPPSPPPKQTVTAIKFTIGSSSSDEDGDDEEETDSDSSEEGM